MNLQSKYIQDENGVKYAPITTPNAIRWPDGSNLNDKLSAFDSVVIEAPVNATDATLPITALTCEAGKYYRIDVAIDTLDVTLPAMTDLTTVRTVVIYLTAGTTPAVTISGTAPAGGTTPDVVYLGGNSIESGKNYEINCHWNGLAWVVVLFQKQENVADNHFIEYLESDGTQYIDLKRNFATSQYKIQLKAMVKTLRGSGSYSGAMGNNAQPQIGWGANGWAVGNANSTNPFMPEVGSIYDIEYSKNFIGDYWVNNEDTGLRRTGTLAGLLFYCEGLPQKVRIYTVKIFNTDNELVMDLVPIRVSILNKDFGFMYDKVSGQLFGNAGTGSFILGPDV